MSGEIVKTILRDSLQTSRFNWRRADERIMKQLEQLEARVGKPGADIAMLLRAMRELVGPAKTPSRGIGFLAEIKSLRQGYHNL